jgi:putative pyruvate formate lyase activating enzyme
MPQYYPAHQADKYEEINRRITDEEFLYALDAAKSVGLVNIER